MSDFHREDFDVPMAEVDGEEDGYDDDISIIDGGDDDGISIDGGDKYGNGKDDENIVYLEKEMLMILNNDPSLTTLEVGYKEDEEGEYFSYFHPPGNDWLALGKAVGNNSHLQEISVDISSATTEQFWEFVPGLSLNRSIKKLTITDWDISVVGVQYNLIRFFNDNQAFESLNVETRRREGEGVSAMVFALRSFNSLKEIKLNLILVELPLRLRDWSTFSRGVSCCNNFYQLETT
jgi:hypothetical protein